MASKYVLPKDTNNVQVNPTTDESIILLRKIVKLLESNAVVDAAQRQRVAIEPGVTNLTVTATQGTASNLLANVNSTPVAGAVNMGNVTVQWGAQATAAAAGVDSRFSMIDWARTAYADGIRRNLVWS